MDPRMDASNTVVGESSRTAAPAPALLLALLFAASLVLLGALTATNARAATTEGAVISNGTVQLGVNAQGSLNYDCLGAGDVNCPPASQGGTDQVGLRFIPGNLESTAPGCLCEGWGLADAGSGLTGFANEAAGDGNITVASFTATDTTAVSTVDIADPAIPGMAMRIVQDYHPSGLSPNIYANTVTVTNTGTGAITDLRYRRVMDWDIEPTPFEEWVTSRGNTPQLLGNTDDGFAESNPLEPRTYINAETVCGPDYPGVCEFTDLGAGGTYPTVTDPDDHGGLYDFGFGALAPGETKSFTVIYGAAPSEADALNALTASGAQVFSLGQSNCQGPTVETCGGGGGDRAPRANEGVELGLPATFMFAFVTATSDLEIKKKAPKNGSINKKLTYTLTITNLGPDEARGVQVFDQLPEGVEFVSASGSQGSCSLQTDPYVEGPGTVVCDLGSIANGASVTIEIVVIPKQSGKLTNTATVSALSEDRNQGNNSASDSTNIGEKHCKIVITGKDLKGTNGNNNLKGTKRSDRIRGLGGNDKIDGKKDHDCLIGKEGDDEIVGDDGNDVIRGGGDDDKITGGKGKDDIKLQNGDDQVFAGKDNDKIKAQARGSDEVDCGSGKDVVIGGPRDKIADNCEKIKLV